MAASLLCIYVALIFVRPMEWWAPMRGETLVLFAAAATMFAALPRLLNDHFVMWRLPEVKLGLFLLMAASLSWLYPFWGTGIIDTFLDFGKIIFLYIMVVLLARYPKYFRWLLWTVVLCVAWMAIHGVLQAHTGAGFGNLRPFPRREEGKIVYQIIAFGIFNDPNDLCLAFICVLPLLYALYRSSSSLVGRLAAAGIIPLALYGAWLTNSRGGVVGLLGMMGAYAMVRVKGIYRWIVISAGVLMVTVVAPSRFARGMSVDLGRVNAWGDGITAFKSYPIFGVGYGAFGDYSDKVAHNSFIHTLTELGLFGYIPWFMLIALTLLHLRRAIALRENVTARDHFLLSGLFSALVGYLTAVYFLSRQYNPVLYIFLGLAIGQVWIACRDRENYLQVFGPIKQDMKRCFQLCIASIPVMWITVRIANSLGR